jgi:hypothetical protein
MLLAIDKIWKICYSFTDLSMLILMLKSALYFILGIISFLFLAPVYAKGKELVVAPFHPHTIYWTTLGLLILTLLCMVCSPHRED